MVQKKRRESKQYASRKTTTLKTTHRKNTAHQTPSSAVIASTPKTQPISHLLYAFKKKDLPLFLLALGTQSSAINKNKPASTISVYAPLKKPGDITRFCAITKQTIAYLSLEENSLFPIKEHFFAKQETLFTFNAKGIAQSIPAIEPKVFFGLRRCDLAGIAHQDKAFLEGGFYDPYYAARRKETTLLGYHCKTAPSPYCFCGSLNLEITFDLMFYEPETVETNAIRHTAENTTDADYFFVEAGSVHGESIIKKHSKLFSQTAIASSNVEKKIPNSDRLEKLDLKPLYSHPDWKKGVDLCLSCGACTTLCPTCYCFELKDHVKMSNLKEGERTRSWSSCQVPEFSKVAGGHVFREKREERFKHRIYHQLDYFKERMGVDLCTGCGRCIAGCPTRIDFVDIINKMK